MYISEKCQFYKEQMELRDATVNYYETANCVMPVKEDAKTHARSVKNELSVSFPVSGTFYY